MKNKCTIVFFSAALLLTGTCVRAQDSTKNSAIKQINKSSEKADNLYGKKIQQQSLVNSRFQKPDTVAAANPAKKKQYKRKRKHC